MKKSFFPIELTEEQVMFLKGRFGVESDARLREVFEDMIRIAVFAIRGKNENKD